MKICSTSLVIRKMHIKTTMRYNSTFTKTAIIKKRDNNKCIKDEKNTKLSYTARGNIKMIPPLWKTLSSC